MSFNFCHYLFYLQIDEDKKKKVCSFSCPCNFLTKCMKALLENTKTFLDEKHKGKLNSSQVLFIFLVMCCVVFFFSFVHYSAWAYFVDFDVYMCGFAGEPNS